MNSSETVHCQNSEMERLTKIIQDMADIDEKGNTHLHLGAVCPEYPGLLGILLANNPKLKKSVNNYNKQGYTPLHLALIKNNPIGALALIEAGTDVNLPTRDSELWLTI